ncbi:MAG TPA: transporter [Pseudomonadales bacterium]|nr:transporter [Pseudomonadales bacterium]
MYRPGFGPEGNLRPVATLVAALLCLSALQARAADDAEELAMKLANPVASLVSVPMQLNYDGDIGPGDDGERYTLNVQPVVPIDLNDDWNLISRTILPLVSQDDLFPGAGSQTGVGDVLQSAFLSPKAPTAGGWILGAGPVLLLPTGTDDLLTADKWGAGPTAVALKQDGPWTYGALVNHVWSFAGDDDRRDVDQSFVQPFLSYTTPTAMTFTLNTESTYDWKGEDWSVPVNVTVAQVLKFGDQLVSIGGGLRYWVQGPDSAPEGLGARLVFTLIFPK